MMVTCNAVFQSVEFYVILTVAAAAVVAFCTRPSGRGPAQTHLVGGWLTEGAPDVGPQVLVECLENGDVVLTRTGLTDIYATGAASLAITQTGNDIVIKERLTPGAPCGTEMTTATFTLDFLGQEWYHIKYEGDTSTSLFAAFRLHVRPGIRMMRPLTH